jgi:hypothetical protein
LQSSSWKLDVHGARFTVVGRRRLIAIAVGAALVLATSAATCSSATSASAGPTTYYVNAQTGADSNSGTSADVPWKTIAMANAAAQPGDTVVLSGHFVQQAIAPSNSGTATAPITYQADPAGATLNQPGLVGGTPFMAWFGDRSYITVNGIGFTNSDYVKAPVTNEGVVLRGSDHITISNCSFTHMQMQLIDSSNNLIENNTWRQFVSLYVKGRPQTAGDMLNLILGSNDNEIVGNDMRYAGHSLIEIGNGTGNSERNANNSIHVNTLSNPWYKEIVLSDNGAGTVVENNQLLAANSVPTLYSTIPGQKGQLQTSDAAVQFSGENFTLRNNTIANSVCTYGCITFGGRWYVGPGAAPGGTLVQSVNNQVYGNAIRNSKGAATFSFVEFLSPQDVAAGRRAVPRISGNLIHDNTIVGASGTPYSWNGTRFYSTVLYHSSSRAPRWKSLHGNKIYNNHGFSQTHVYLIDGVFPGGATLHRVESLAQFEASYPGFVYRNG